MKVRERLQATYKFGYVTKELQRCNVIKYPLIRGEEWLKMISLVDTWYDGNNIGVLICDEAMCVWSLLIEVREVRIQI